MRQNATSPTSPSEIFIFYVRELLPRSELPLQNPVASKISYLALHFLLAGHLTLHPNVFFLRLQGGKWPFLRLQTQQLASSLLICSTVSSTFTCNVFWGRSTAPIHLDTSNVQQLNIFSPWWESGIMLRCRAPRGLSPHRLVTVPPGRARRFVQDEFVGRCADASP